jgi:hypothetical protein
MSLDYIICENGAPTRNQPLVFNCSYLYGLEVIPLLLWGNVSLRVLCCPSVSNKLRWIIGGIKNAGQE